MQEFETEPMLIGSSWHVPVGVNAIDSDIWEMMTMDYRHDCERQNLKIRFFNRDDSWTSYYYIDKLPDELLPKPIGYQSTCEIALNKEDRQRVQELLEPIIKSA